MAKIELPMLTLNFLVLSVMLHLIVSCGWAAPNVGIQFPHVKCDVAPICAVTNLVVL